MADAQGNLYGTAQAGGGSGCGGSGCGIVFKLAPDGQETVLHAFDGDDGAFPVTGLVADTAGNLYGATINGGSKCACGVVFKVTPGGQESALHAFSGRRDGSRPLGDLVSDAAGNLYGTTTSGGRKCGCGTVFKLTPQGKKTVVYSFAGGMDGSSGDRTVARRNGNFYGTTANGGIDCDGSGFGCGNIFKLGPTDKRLCSIASKAASHGADPAAGLIMDATGTLYGTTNNGGWMRRHIADCGMVFKLAPDGNETGSTFSAAASRTAAIPGRVGGGRGRKSLRHGRLRRRRERLRRAVPDCTQEASLKIVYTFSGGRDGGGPFAGLIRMPPAISTARPAMAARYSDGTVFKLRK